MFPVRGESFLEDIAVCVLDYYKSNVFCGIKNRLG